MGEKEFYFVGLQMPDKVPFNFKATPSPEFSRFFHQLLDIVFSKFSLAKMIEFFNRIDGLTFADSYETRWFRLPGILGYLRDLMTYVSISIG
jgi:hypothetical protein